MWFNDIILIFHFLGLALGFGGGFANGILAMLMGKATPEDAAVLARVPPLASRLSDIGRVLLWVTGIILVFSKWNIGAMPVMFWIKIVAVLVLTGNSGYMHMLKGKAKAGDTAAAALIPKLGPINMVAAIAAVVFAVFAFH